MPAHPITSPAEHHRHDVSGVPRRRGLANEHALAQDGRPRAQELDILQLVGDEDDGPPLRRESLERGKELLLLRQADSGGRLVQDQHPRAQPQETEDLQLLALSHGQRVHERIGLEAEGELLRQGLEGSGGGPPVGEEPARTAEDEVVQDGEGRKVEGILMEHSDALPDGIRRGTDDRRSAVQEDLAFIGTDEAGQDLHQRALARPVLPEDPMDRGRADGERDPVVRADAAERLADAAKLDLHGG
jgi:hypothetical protein